MTSQETNGNVNVTELQRLNDAITLTLDAIRRVAPQLSMMSAQHPFGGGVGVGIGGYGNGYGYGYGFTQPSPTGWSGQPWGATTGLDPITAAYMQGHAHGRASSPGWWNPVYGPR